MQRHRVTLNFVLNSVDLPYLRHYNFSYHQDMWIAAADY